MYTIITVCLNAADDLEKTIQSVLMQKDCEIEYIIKDGVSTDHTKDVVQKYEPALQKLSRFVFVSEKDAGFVVNLGSATAEDVRGLLASVAQIVMEKSGVQLEPEVRIW